VAILPSLKTFLSSHQGNIPDITKKSTKIGNKIGTNPGGEYLIDGKHHYVKFYSNPQQAATEVATAHVYHALDIETVKPFMVRHRGDDEDRIGIASEWQSHMKPLGVNFDYKTLSDDDRHELAKHFVAAVVTKNWDAVGLVHDNIARNEHGKLMNTDLGGAMRFRAQGEPKPFGGDIDEYNSLRVRGRPSGKAFSVLEDRHIHKAIHGLKRLDRNALASHFLSVWLEDPDGHADAIENRKQKLLRMIPE
jgi:hypothetical protein